MTELSRPAESVLLGSALPRERPTLPGSPSTPLHPPHLRLAYGAVGTIIGITGGLGNALVSANLVYLQGSLGAYAAEVAWLPAAYVMTSSRLEWSVAQSEYRAATAAIPQLERAIAQQENGLSVLIGANPGPIRRGPPLSELRLPALQPDGLPSELLRRRPDIAQAQNAVAAADAALAAAHDPLLPSLRLSASAGVQGYTLTQLIDAPNRLWSIGGSILAPIFEGGRLQAQAEIAASQRDRAVYAYEQVVRNAFAEADTALAGALFLRQQVAEQRERLAAAREALRIVPRRYRNGYASYLEELDAQRTLYAVEVALIQLQATALVTQVDLYRVFGGGWRPQ